MCVHKKQPDSTLPVAFNPLCTCASSKVQVVSNASNGEENQIVPRYRVVVTGVGMDIPPHGCSGFATTRFVRAESENAAANIALQLVAEAVAAEQAFVSSPKPTLAVDQVLKVRSPFKRSRPNRGFSFIGRDATLEDTLHLERQAGAGWWL
jgi:hypothetical protein